MSAEMWGFAGVLVTQAVVLVGLVLQRRQTSRVDKKVEPISNGFGASVVNKLTQLDEKLDRLDARMDAHEKDHSPDPVVRPIRRRVW